MNAIDGILDFWDEHKKAVIAVIIMVLCLMISASIANSFVKKRDAAYRSLQDVNNEITQVEDQLKQPVTKYRDLDHGYSAARVAQDTLTLEGKGTGVNNSNEWLSAFLTWSSGSEYETNRQWFIEKLGSNNVFVTDIMRSYDSTNLSLDNSSLIDPDKISCKLSDTKFYVESIDENTGVYNYVIVAYFNGKNAFSNSAFTAMDKVQCYIITVSTDADGNVMPETWTAAAGPVANIY